MPVTLTDEQVAQLRSRLEAGDRAIPIAQSATEIWNHQQWGDEAKALWKKAFPEVKIDGFDAEQRINARLDKERQEREEREKKARERAEEDEWKTKRQAAKEKYSLTDDAMDRLEKLMTERRVADYDIAATYLVSQEPSPSEGTAEYDRHFWHHDRTPEYKQIASDPEGYAREEIMRAIKTDAQRAGNR